MIFFFFVILQAENQFSLFCYSQYLRRESPFNTFLSYGCGLRANLTLYILVPSVAAVKALHIGELVNTNAPTQQNDKLTVIWNSYICGLLNGNNLSLSRTMEAINQAFVQSPYLKK